MLTEYYGVLNFDDFELEEAVLGNMYHYFHTALECLHNRNSDPSRTNLFLGMMIDGLRKEGKHYRSISLDNWPTDLSRMYVETILEIDDNIPYFYKSEKVEKVLGNFLVFGDKMDEFRKTHDVDF